MKFGVHLSNNLTPEWNSQYIQYEYMKQLLEKAVSVAPLVTEDGDTTARDEYFRRADENFFEYCQKQLTKINTFFSEKLAEASRRFETLKDEVRYRQNLYGEVKDQQKTSNGLFQPRNKVGQLTNDPHRRTSRSHRPSIITPLSRIIPDRLLKEDGHEQRQPKHLANSSTLKTAFSEFYLMLFLLQKYQFLNYTGFRKILKKHDKLFKTTRGLEWRKTHVDCAKFYTSTAVTELIQDVETIYTDAFEAGDRARAMKRLRVPPLEERQSPIVTFRVGLFMGMICILLPALIIAILVLDHSRSGNPVHWRQALNLYRSTFLIILHIIFVGINVYGWSSAGVNHILIFEIDPRNHLAYQQLLEMGTCLMVIWLLSYLAFVFTAYVDFYPFIHPFMLVLFMILFLVNPFPIFHRSARYWLLKTLGRIVTSAFHTICFKDFWLTNQIASLELALFDIEYFTCFYMSDHHWWSTNLTSPASPQGLFCTGRTRFVLQAFLLAIPSSLRFTQCIRRYYDSKKKNPHLLNAGKYASSFFVAITNSLRRASMSSYTDKPTTNPFIYLWIVTAFISSTYKVTWDLKKDWGFFDKNAGENKFLRDQLVYPSKLFYYYAIVQDIIFRYIWMINIFVYFNTETAEYADVIGFSYGLIELFRRFFWNFFRLENEHLNNCGQFRAVRDISIAPLTTGINFALIESKLSREPGIRRRRLPKIDQTIIEEETVGTNDDASPVDLQHHGNGFVDYRSSALNTSTLSVRQPSVVSSEENFN